MLERGPRPLNWVHDRIAEAAHARSQIDSRPVVRGGDLPNSPTPRHPRGASGAAGVIAKAEQRVGYAKPLPAMYRDPIWFGLIRICGATQRVGKVTLSTIRALPSSFSLTDLVIAAGVVSAPQ